MMDKSHECPFCGERVAKIADCKELEECANFEECHAEYPYVCVVCTMDKGGCGASSGYYDSADKAVEAWNRRKNAETTEAEKDEKYYANKLAAFYPMSRDFILALLQSSVISGQPGWEILKKIEPADQLAKEALKDNNVVSHCPIRGHAPMCSRSECNKASLDGYKSCKEAMNAEGVRT